MISISMVGSGCLQLWAAVTCCVAGELGAEGEGDSIPVIVARMGIPIGLLSHETM